MSSIFDMIHLSLPKYINYSTIAMYMNISYIYVLTVHTVSYYNM